MFIEQNNAIVGHGEGPGYNFTVALKYYLGIRFSIYLRDSPGVYSHNPPPNPRPDEVCDEK